MARAHVYGNVQPDEAEPGAVLRGEQRPAGAAPGGGGGVGCLTGRRLGWLAAAVAYTLATSGAGFWAGSRRLGVQPEPAAPENRSGLFATLQVAQLPFRRNWAQSGAAPTELWIEVGSNSRHVLQDQMAGAFRRGAFLVTFEPLLDKYAYLLGRFGGQADSRRQLGLQHQRGVVLPFAVGCNGTATFNVAPVDGCSSLLKPRGEAFAKDPKKGMWPDWVVKSCATAAELRTVPCISLERVIEEWLEARDIQYLKVDAQGFDLQVVKSAGRMLKKLKRVLLEVQCDNAAMIYAGQPNCSSTYSEMVRLGFGSRFDPSTCLTCRETDIEFFRL